MKWFEYTKGVSVEVGIIQKWINEVVRIVRDGEPYYSISSGNSLVMATKCNDEIWIHVVNNGRYICGEFNEIEDIPPIGKILK